MALCSTWVTALDRCEPCLDYVIDTAALEDWELVASELLYMFSGQQFPGECDVVVQPCSCRWFGSGGFINDGGILTVSRWPMVQACSCRSIDSCSCTHSSVVTLPHPNATAVTEVVTTDDGTLSPSAYELRGQQLVRLDGELWPICDDGFRVSYTYGIAPPAPLRRAAAILACEFLIGCDPESFSDVECRLPRNVVSIARQGVSVVFQSAFFTPQDGRPVQFGIPEIDMALSAYNKYGLTAPSVFLSPDDGETARLVT